MSFTGALIQNETLPSETPGDERRLYTYKPENIRNAPALLPRQQWPNSLCLGFIFWDWEPPGDVVRSGKSFSHLLLLAPLWKTVPKPSPAVAMCSRPEVENETHGWEKRASLHWRKEREYQIKWEAQLPYPWETCQFLKVTEIMAGCDALFLICWYKIEHQRHLLGNKKQMKRTAQM